jgi:hypothetical protein
MIYLVGVNHDAAARYELSKGKTSTHREFEEIVESAINSLNPSLVAEEDNPCLWLTKDEFKSILREVTEVHQVKTGRYVRHEYADPDQKLRRSLNYKTGGEIERIYDSDGNYLSTLVAKAHEIAHHFHKREEQWLSVIQDHIKSGVLFICGDLHITTFTELLERENFEFNVIRRGVGVGNSTREIGEYCALKFARKNLTFREVCTRCQ